MPLILAASAESNASKHQRLAEQLRWAQKTGVLEGGLQFLIDLQPDQWNEGTVESWQRSSY